jgi:hypothetical protein
MINKKQSTKDKPNSQKKIKETIINIPDKILKLL